MKKIFLPVLVLVVLVGGYFVFSNKRTSTQETQTPDRKMSFSSFLESDNGSYVCTVNQSVGGTESDGTVYISGSNNLRKIKGEFTSTVQGMTINTNFVMKDGFSYTWSSAAPTMGFKVKVAEVSTSNPNASTAGSYVFNSNQIGSYDCQEWSTEESKFALPSNIKFMEVPQVSSPQTSVKVNEETKAPVQSNTIQPTQPTTPVTSALTMTEVAKHSTDKSCYSVINGNVYDLTSYIYKHKGGASKILRICGKDGSSLFEGQHGGESKPEQILASLKIGPLSN